MNLHSFLWLWKIAAWSMVFSLVAYFLLAVSGSWMAYTRLSRRKRPQWLRPLHYTVGGGLVVLVLLLLSIGIVGTLGYYGSLGHSMHLVAGLCVVGLVLLSAWSATQISPKRPWARAVHVGTNVILLVGLALVSWTGWSQQFSL